MPINPRNHFDRAAIDHTSIKVTERTPPVGKIVFSKPDGDNLQMNIVNSPIAYPPDKRQEFGEKIQFLQKEGRLEDSGSVGIYQLLAM